MNRSRLLLAALLISTPLAGPAAAQSRIHFNSTSFQLLQDQAGPAAATAKAPDARGSQQLDPEALKQLGLAPEDLNRLEGIATLIKQDWVDGDSLTSEKLRTGAIRGMVKELDPHSEFYTPEEYKQFQQVLKGSYAGIGAVLKAKEKGAGQTILFPYPGSPAQQAGVKAGDVIIWIGSDNVGPMTGDEVVAKLKGDPGTQVTVKIARLDAADPKKEPQLLSITITRAEVEVPNIYSDVLDGNVGYIYFSDFRDKDTEFAFEKALRGLAAKGISKLIIDERGNPGGSVNSAIKIADLFLDKGQKIVSMKDRKGDEQIAYAPKDGPLAALPVRVIVNGMSASAAEIVAGALQDNHKARVVGSQSFGKGSAQAIIQLKDLGAIKITINKWYTPSGKSIQGDEGGLKKGVGVRGGITPDDPVTVSEQDEAKIMTRVFEKLMHAPLDPAGPVEDPALKKALE